jgi:hypothetical protein
MSVNEHSVYKIYTMVADKSGKPIGNRDVLEYRFVPRIGEHVLLKSDEDPERDDIFEVIDVRHQPPGDFEIWVCNLGFHLDYRNPLKQ